MTDETKLTDKSHSFSVADRLAAALHYDFCPSANRWFYWMKSPLAGLAAAAIGAISVGLAVNPAVLVAAGAIVAIAILGLIWPMITARGLRCELEFEKSRGREGQPCGVILRVANRWPWPAWGLSLQQGFVEGIPNATEGAALARVPGRSQGEYRWEFTPPRRGVYPLTSPRIETGFPFGIWNTGVEAQVVRPLIVWPHTVDLHHLPELAAADSLDDLLSDRKAGDFGDLLGTRPFREGDSLRRVHWSQTARHGRLIVCERQAGAVAAIAVDADLVAESFAEASECETAIRIVASLCESLPRLHAHLDCRIGGELIPVAAGPNGARRALDALARVPRGGFTVTPRHSPLRRLSEGVLHLVVTGSKRTGIPSNNSTRVIAVGATEIPSCSRRHRAWMLLESNRLADLPAAWRRACHAT